MQRLPQFLKSLFAPSSQQSLSLTAAEPTLHDVLRICATRVPQQPRPAVSVSGYQLVTNGSLEMSRKPETKPHSHSFGRRLAAYGTDQRESRFALIKRQTL